MSRKMEETPIKHQFMNFALGCNRLLKNFNRKFNPYTSMEGMGSLIGNLKSFEDIFEIAFM